MAKQFFIFISFLYSCFSYCQTKPPLILYNNNENIEYTIYYSVIGIYFKAGTANFKVNLENFQNQDVYHFTGLGFSNSNYDWIFKVRDKYESFVTIKDFKPLFFNRQIEEGKFKHSEQISFDYNKKKAISPKGEYSIPDKVQDVLSSIYFARNISYDSFKLGEKIYFDMFLDNELFKAYIKYEGKEILKTKIGSFKTIKFKPLLIKGTIFKGGETMTVWVTDDQNHIPLKIYTPISVGSIRCEVNSISNNKFPLTSKIEEKK
ncbi:MAG: DUF3108 domain-containing protein [Sediminibacterium sp.]|nr:DUF3108 domain-containing protein [Sediminibacterium sp.]